MDTIQAIALCAGSFIFFGYGVIKVFAPDLYWHYYREDKGINPESFEPSSVMNAERLFWGAVNLIGGAMGLVVGAIHLLNAAF